MLHIPIPTKQAQPYNKKLLDGARCLVFFLALSFKIVVFIVKKRKFSVNAGASPECVDVVKTYIL